MTSQAKLPGGQVVKWQDKEFPNAYVNIMGFTMTAFDISLILGQIGDATPSEVTGIPQVKVTLSPEQALNMMKLLSLAVETYTNNHGPLRTSGEVDLEQLRRQMENTKRLLVESEDR
jgi:hypothetical protein